MRTLALVAAVLAAAVLVGVVGQLGDAAPGVPGHATALGAPWLVAAFVIGALLRRPLPGALGGAVVLSGGTLSYYGVQLALTGHARALADGAIAVGWAAAGAVAGAAMGALGALWRDATRARGAAPTVAATRASGALSAGAATPARRPRRGAALLAAVPAAALAGEALLLAGEWRSRASLAVLSAELALAGLLLPACAWRRASLPAAALAAGALALGFALTEAELRSAMRAIGWRGA
jgi:hypothetical protein